MDWIKCKRDTPIFRLGCQINPEPVTVSLLMRKTFVNSGFRSFGVHEIMSVQDASKISHRALIPQLKVRIHWTTDCFGPDVFNGNIFIYVNTQTSEDKIVRPGDQEYSLSVSRWSITDVEPDYLKIETTFAIQDKSSQPIIPPSEGGISPNCKMLVSDLRLEFDAPSVSQALSELEKDAKAQSIIMLVTTLLHGQFINDKNISICQLIRLANGLRRIQGVGTTGDLKLSAQRLIADFVEQALAKGVITKPADKDAFQFFLENEGEFNTLVGGLECANIQATSLIPSKESFIENGSIINPEGVANAERYINARNELKGILATAWTLLSAIEASIKASQQIEWVANFSQLVDTIS